MNTRTIYSYTVKEIDGITVQFFQKNIKRISLKITPQGIVMSSRPIGVSLDTGISFVRKNMEWIKSTREKMLQKRKNSNPESPFTLAEINAFRAKVSRLFPQCEARMNLYASRVTIRSMTSRWGSCSSKNAISINLRLARYPDECLEYVIIHELAHIVHRNHAADFWNLVAAFCPDWKRIRRSLRES